METGARVRVAGGKYDGETGTIKSVAAQSCKLTIDGAVTGNIKKTALTVLSADRAAKGATQKQLCIPTPSLPYAVSPGASVLVTSGTHAGKTGTIVSATAKSCRVSIDGTTTGNLKLSAVTLASTDESGTHHESPSGVLGAAAAAAAYEYPEETKDGHHTVSEGAIVIVSGGAYGGDRGTVISVASSTCRLLMADGTRTGNIKLSAVAVAADTPSTPTKKGAGNGGKTVQQSSPNGVEDFPSDSPQVFALAIGASQDPDKKVGSYVRACCVRPWWCPWWCDTCSPPIPSFTLTGGLPYRCRCRQQSLYHSHAERPPPPSPPSQFVEDAANADVDMRQVRYIPRRVALRSNNALPDVLSDVINVKSWLEEGNVNVNRFVGRDDTNSLTKRAFLSKVNKLFEQPGSLFILYYAGHGTDETRGEAAPGAFCMQKDG